MKPALGHSGFAASSKSTRRPSWSRSCSASSARASARALSRRIRRTSQPTISATITSAPIWKLTKFAWKLCGELCRCRSHSKPTRTGELASATPSEPAMP
jgi:hypothetical protein